MMGLFWARLGDLEMHDMSDVEELQMVDNPLLEAGKGPVQPVEDGPRHTRDATSQQHVSDVQTELVQLHIDGISDKETSELLRLREQLANRDKVIRQNNAALADRDKVIRQRDETVRRLQAQVSRVVDGSDSLDK